MISKNIIRDNVNFDVHASDFVFDLIDTEEFQRLRRIKQLGGAFLVYPGANHTRFQHCIGVMHNINKLINENNTHKFTKYQQKLLQAAAILHDIGHGPYSHTFEDISLGICNHEKIGFDIILSKDTEVNKVLIKHKVKPQDVVDMFDKNKNPIFKQILSSHIDVDRMDYLIRDAVHTGTNYGLIDKDKLIKSMDLSGKKEIIFKYSSLSAIESFLFARYQAFRSVYLHRIGLIHSEMIKILLARLFELRKESEYKSFYEKLSVIWDKKTDIKKYLSLDDEVFNTIIFDLSKTSDKIIADIARKVRNRNFFEAWTKLPITKFKVKAKLKQKGYDPKYYFIETTIKKNAYSTKNNGSIKIKDKNGKVVSLEKLSPLIRNLSDHEFIESYFILPKGILK